MREEDKSTHQERVFPPDDLITSEVLAGLRDGDSESFQKIYLRWRKPIRNFIFSLQDSATEADDLTQDIFTALWNYREKIDPEKNISSFLFLVARRTVYSSFRTKQAHDRYAESVWPDESDPYTSHDMIVEKEAELLKRVLLQRMPAQQRKIFEMSHDEGLTPEDIADRLGVKRETVYNQLSKARKEIRDTVILLLVIFAAPMSDHAILEIIDSLLR